MVIIPHAEDLYRLRVRRKPRKLRKYLGSVLGKGLLDLLCRKARHVLISAVCEHLCRLVKARRVYHALGLIAREHLRFPCPKHRGKIQIFFSDALFI